MFLDRLAISTYVGSREGYIKYYQKDQYKNVIQNIKDYPENELTIFNRWGDIIFQAAPYNNNWNGQNQT